MAHHFLLLGFSQVLIHRTLAGVGALGIVAGVVGVVGASLAEGFASGGAMQGNPRMTEGFEGRATIGTV